MAVSIGSATTVVFDHVSGGLSDFENTILGSCSILGERRVVAIRDDEHDVLLGELLVHPVELTRRA